MQYNDMIRLILNPLSHFMDNHEQCVQRDHVLGEWVVEYLGKQCRNLAWTQIEEDVVVLKLCVQIISDLDIVLVVSVAHTILVDRWSKENLAGYSVESVQVLNLVVVRERVPGLGTEDGIPICFELLLLLLEPQFSLIFSQGLGVGPVDCGLCKLVVFYDLRCYLIENFFH